MLVFYVFVSKIRNNKLKIDSVVVSYFIPYLKYASEQNYTSLKPLYAGNIDLLAKPSLITLATLARSSPINGNLGALTCSVPIPVATSAILIF